MNVLGCRTFRRDLSAYLDGELPPPDRARLQAHARTCPDCLATLRRTARLGRRVRATPRRLPPADLTARVLEASQHRRSAALATLTDAPRAGFELRAARLVATAAVVLVAAAAFTVGRWSASTTDEPAHAPRHTDEPDDTGPRTAQPAAPPPRLRPRRSLDDLGQPPLELAPLDAMPLPSTIEAAPAGGDADTEIEIDSPFAVPPSGDPREPIDRSAGRTVHRGGSLRVEVRAGIR